MRISDWSSDVCSSDLLAYVSFEKGNSSIYIQDITTGSRELISSFRGINSSPAFSPDGRRLALPLSRSGNPEIYLMDLGRSEEHTSELQSLMRISYAVFCLNKKTRNTQTEYKQHTAPH